MTPGGLSDPQWVRTNCVSKSPLKGRLVVVVEKIFGSSCRVYSRNRV